MHPLAVARRRPQQLGGRARDPAPDDARQFVITAAQPLRLALGDLQRVAAMPPHKHQRRLPDLPLVGHHHSNFRAAATVPFDANGRSGRAASRAISCCASVRFTPHPACAPATPPYNPGAMADLFENTARKLDDSYSARDIEVLEGLEPVRRRPGMYVGGTDERALHHLAAEALDNAMDEAVAGHATRIELELGAEGWVTVRDNGRGIPVDKHPRFPDKSALEVILTTLHSGGKFGGDAYKTSGGLHGVGVSVVNALSDKLSVEVALDRKLYTQEYSRGKPKTKLKQSGTTQNKRGTAIRFHPDPEIFGPKPHFS